MRKKFIKKSFHCCLTEKSDNDESNSIAITKSHSKEIYQNSRKADAIIHEKNIEKNGEKEQFTYVAVLPQRKITNEMCSNPFRINNKTNNFLMENLVKTRDTLATGLILNNETNIINHIGERRIIVRLDELEKKNLSLESQKFLGEYCYEVKEELNKLIDINFTKESIDEKEKIKNIIIESFKKMSRKEFIEYSKQEAYNREDMENFYKLKNLENFEKQNKLDI